VAGVATSWRTIEGVLWENAHSVFRALRKPATDTQVARLAKLLPAKLPRDFVLSLKTHDGLRDSYLGLNRLFDNYALLPASAIIAEYRMLCRLQAMAESGGSPTGADAGIRNDAHWRPGWVPILDADGASRVVLDLDPAPDGTVGQVIEWYFGGGLPLRLLAPSFGQWLAGLAESLSQRRFGLDEFGGIWLGGVPKRVEVEK
jgi:cell wall assembly regulator SMI1